jgi:hypothetical protein
MSEIFLRLRPHQIHVRWVPCHHGMARPQVMDVKWGLLSQRHGVPSGCGWRRHPPGMEGSYEYIE